MSTMDLEPRDARRLADIFAAAPEGTHIHLGAGTYDVTRPLVIARGLRITGEPGRTILAARDTKVFWLTKPRTEVALVGLVVEGGRGTSGGALTAQHDARLTIELCRFVRNTVLEEGAAIHLSAIRAAKIVNTIFEENEAGAGGAAVTLTDGGKLTCDRCLFVGNRSVVGGAVLVRANAALELVHCTFVGNEASWPRGGGALFVLAGETSPSSVLVANCVVHGEDAICADATKAYRISVRSSVVPADAFRTERVDDVGGNTRAAPVLGRGDGLLRYALDPTSPGAGTADASLTPPGAVDLFGRPLRHDGRVDPGALAHPVRAAR